MKVPVLASAVLTAAALAQTPAPQTGLVIGRVIEAGTRQPVDGALVTLTPSGQNLRRESVITDPQGRFLFRGVAKGEYRLWAEQSGYLRGHYGRIWPTGFVEGAPQLLDVGDGERIPNLTIRLWKYGAIGGRVTDETGAPIAGAIVRGLMKTIVAGRPMFAHNTLECLGSCLSATTDDRGEYRFARLTPGEYLVVVPTVMSSAPVAVQRLLAAGRMPDALNNSGVGAVAWLGGGGTPASEGVRTAEGRHILSNYARGAPVANLSDGGELSIYPTQFFPGTSRLADAAAISIGFGDERSNVDFSLRPVRTVRVSGTVAGADGPRADYALRLVPTGEDALRNDHEIATTVSDTDGSFTFLGVPAGSYLARVVLRQVARSDADTRSGPLQWGETAVNVGDSDIDGLHVAIRDALRITGRVVFDGAAPPRERPLRVMLERADGRETIDVNYTQSGFNQDGQFELRGLPGRYVIRGTSPPGWLLKSAVLAGRDVSEEPIDLDAGDLAGVVVTFTDRPLASVIGRVVTAKGDRDPEAMVVVFPADRAYWSDKGMLPRRFAAAGTTRDGTFVISGLQNGEYLMAAMSNDTEIAWREPRVLAEIARTATRVPIREGATPSVDLRSTTIAAPRGR